MSSPSSCDYKGGMLRSEDAPNGVEIRTYYLPPDCSEKTEQTVVAGSLEL
jgi:hypothetical protein